MEITLIICVVQWSLIILAILVMYYIANIHDNLVSKIKMWKKRAGRKLDSMLCFMPDDCFDDLVPTLNTRDMSHSPNERVISRFMQDEPIDPRQKLPPKPQEKRKVIIDVDIRA